MNQQIGHNHAQFCGAKPPVVKHHDHNYVEMAHLRALSAWLRGAAGRLTAALTDADSALGAAQDASAQASALLSTLEQALGLLTKAQIMELAAGVGIEGLSDSQRKDELVEALVAAVVAHEPASDAAPDDAGQEG